jgi:hypothetical protein
LKTPGKAISLYLSIVAVVSIVFPIISLPHSITGLVISRRARAFEKKELGKAVALVNASYYISMLSALATLGIMLYALPGAVIRNLM